MSEFKIYCGHKGCRGRWIVKVRRVSDRFGFEDRLVAVEWRRPRRFVRWRVKGRPVIVEHRSNELSWVDGYDEIDTPVGSYEVLRPSVQCSDCGHWTDLPT